MFMSMMNPVRIISVTIIRLHGVPTSQRTANAVCRVVCQTKNQTYFLCNGGAHIFAPAAQFAEVGKMQEIKYKANPP